MIDMTSKKRAVAPRDLYRRWPWANTAGMEPDMVRLQIFVQNLERAVIGDGRMRPVTSPSEFCDNIGISHATLGRILRGEVIPRFDTIDKLERGVGRALFPPFEDVRVRGNKG
ncbi:Hypothetical protein (putative DNA-binding protein) [Corynebacterium diphtheriae]|uniref:HTH cro/C1-type domain-containing protein n=1 Tax=Corynebacterium diphtheriae (strain ATCC 700971 / NCTC 13129 / Biotype gravis) TaxID=257309 RepID=Q6NIF9_CORDI|nr:Hypothetical protein (putative DNA-binding protein) [Corynebacterium diphtheriae]